MIKWRIKFFILIFIYESKFINSENYSGNENEDNTYDQYFSYIIEPEITQFKYLNYSDHEFSFRGIDKLKQKDLLVNFYSIDCNINIDIDNINKDSENYVFITGIKSNIYSILIKNNKTKNTELLVRPSIILGNNENYMNSRICPVLINSYYLEESKIIIEKNEYMALNFIENITIIELTYQVKNLTEDHFIVLSFISNENLNFNIDIKNILIELFQIHLIYFYIMKNYLKLKMVY